jgi:hypothetical protein
MNTKALWSVAVLGTVTAFFSGCGDGDSTKIKICNVREVTCLDDRVGEICNADGTRALAFECGDGQRCCDPKKEDDCQDSSGEDIEKASCVGDCTPGATDCGSKAVSLVCNANGKGWSSIPCAAGTGCDSDADSDTFGTCIRSDENIVVCEGGDAVCAGSGTVKTCEEDGSNWVYSSCAANEECSEGECVVNPDKGCVPHSGTCVDLTHVRLCAIDGMSYEDDLVECPAGTTCDQGACQGPVCTAGAYRCDDVRTGSSTVNALAAGTFRAQALYHCNADGTGWDITSCTDSEICVYDNISTNTVNDYIEALKSAQSIGGTGEYPTLLVPNSALASCQKPGCAAPFVLRELYSSSLFSPDLTAGSFMCGDGNDPDSSALESFSLCEGLPPFNNLYWANYRCEDPEVCSYRGAPTSSEESGFVVGPSCSTSCVPGTTACFSESSLASGSLGSVSITGEATIECGDDGVYDPGTVDKCWTGNGSGRELWCGPNLKAADANIGICMEPVCAAWFSVFDTFSIPEDIGACGTDGKFYPCMPDGTFGDAKDCSECQLAGISELPQITGLAETFAGYDPGRCITCTDGQAECLFTDNTTPYFRECVNGAWRTDACDDSLCTTYVDPETALWSTICGAECKPFTSTCGGVDGKQIRTCTSSGVLPDDFVDCKTGACHTDSQSTVGYTASASCEVECIEDSVICAFVDTDEDGFTEDSEITCNSKGRYETADAVACDTSNIGAIETCVPKIGCAECDPGTFSGTPDVRCALDEDGLPLEDPSIQVCKAGKWDDAIPCPGETPVCSLGVCSDLGGTGGQGGGGSN